MTRFQLLSLSMGADGVTTVQLTGEIDIRTASDAQAKVTAALTEDHPDTLVLDLSEVSFLDSVGIGFLVGLNRQADDVGTKLRLRGLQPQVHRVLSATGLIGVLQVDEA